jgi:hypothetical protein
MSNSTRTKRDWIKVMGRLSDPKRRAKIAKAWEKAHGRPMSDPDAFNMYVSFPIDHYGIVGAFEAAREYIAQEVETHRDTFEWKLDGAHW